MDKLNMIKRAKFYIDKLSNGISPIDNTILPKNEIVNNIKVTRCLFFVLNILDEAIKNSDTVNKNLKYKKPFYTTQQKLSDFPYSTKPLSISQITNIINSMVHSEDMKELSCNTITLWLIEKGYLKIIVGEDKKERKIPTDKGEYVGITREARQGNYMDYHVTVYNIIAQKIIIYNICSILSSVPYRYTRQKEPWSKEEIDYIENLIENGKSITEIGLIIKRKNQSIINKLKH